MNKKSGSAATLVKPLDPKQAVEADASEAGDISEADKEAIKAKREKYEKSKVPAFKPPESAEAKEAKKAWVEIVLKDEEGNPVPGERYLVKLPDGTVAEGSLDAEGRARVEGFDPGQCEVTFPDLDTDSWQSA